MDFVQNYKNVGNRSVNADKSMQKQAAQLPAAKAPDPAKATVPESPPTEPELSPKLRPAGRVSLPMDFPVTTSLVHFKKVKDHAALTLTATQTADDSRPRLGSAAMLGGAMLGWLFLNALRKSRSRRRRRLSPA